MKILRVEANNRKHVFEVRTSRESLTFPYEKANPAPSSTDRITKVFVDTELGREAFTYSLASGAEGSVHIDSVLEYNEDPSYMAELTMYQLTQEARARFERSQLSAVRSRDGLGLPQASSTGSWSQRTTPSRSGSCSRFSIFWEPRWRWPSGIAGVEQADNA